MEKCRLSTIPFTQGLREKQKSNEKGCEFASALRLLVLALLPLPHPPRPLSPGR